MKIFSRLVKYFTKIPGPGPSVIARNEATSAHANQNQTYQQLRQRLQSIPRTYTIESDPPRITCHICGRTSYNTNDVEHKYCGHCHQFHSTLRLLNPNK